MRSYDVRTNIADDQIKNIHVIDILQSIRSNINIRSDRIKPVRKIGVSENIRLYTSVNTDGYQAEKMIGAQIPMYMAQGASFSSQKSISATDNITMSTPSLTQSQVVYFVADEITQNNMGFVLPSGSYNKNSFGLRGDIDSLSGNDWSIFNGVNTYLNLDNAGIISNSMTGDESIKIYIATDDVSTHYFSIDISEGHVYCDFNFSRTTSEQYEFNGSEWTYSVVYVEQEFPSSVVDNDMNVVFTISDIDGTYCSVEYFDSSGTQADMNKTIISSYPFDCRNMTSGLGLYNVFYNIDGEWIFQPDRHISPPINT